VISKAVLGASKLPDDGRVHWICETKRGFRTSCGIPLEVVNEEALKSFLDSHKIQICGCENCEKSEENRRRQELKRLQKAVGR